MSDWPITHEEAGVKFRARVHENGLSCEVEVMELNEQDPDQPPRPELRMIVKWDGCIHWDTPGDVMGHFCEPEDLIRVQQAMWIAAALGAKAMGDRVDGAESWIEASRRMKATAL